MTERLSDAEWDAMTAWARTVYFRWSDLTNASVDRDISEAEAIDLVAFAMLFERNEAARFCEAVAEGRGKQSIGAASQKLKQEARDFETMAMQARQLANDIRKPNRAAAHGVGFDLRLAHDNPRQPKAAGVIG